MTKVNAFKVAAPTMSRSSVSNRSQATFCSDKRLSVPFRSRIARRVKFRVAPRLAANMLDPRTSHTTAKSQGVGQDYFIFRTGGSRPRPARNALRHLAPCVMTRSRRPRVAASDAWCGCLCPSRSRGVARCRPQYPVARRKLSAFARTAFGRALHPIARTRRGVRNGRVRESIRWRLAAIRAAARRYVGEEVPRNTDWNGDQS